MLTPNWTLPAGVKAAVTTTAAPGNVAVHVGDDPAQVLLRRRQLVRQLALPSSPRWLQQTHSTRVLNLSALHSDAPMTGLNADASYTNQAHQVCAILTADCLPILIAANDGSEIAAIHAGWRGLAQGIITNTLANFATPASQLTAWIGPAISATAYEVGADVREPFLSQGLVDEISFRPHIAGKWFADLPVLAQRILAQQGVEQITQSGYCTFSDQRFYSYRRNPLCGRIATLIWKI